MSRRQDPPDWLKGSFTPLITPFVSGDINLSAFKQLIEQQIQAGSNGVVVTGTTGEPTSLSVAERAQLISTAVEAASGRIPVVAATGAMNLADTKILTQHAVNAGVSAIMVVAPGFIKPSQNGLINYFQIILGEMETPSLLYNIPGRSGVTIEPATIEEIGSRCPSLVGLKTASPDLEYLTDVLRRVGSDFRIFCGLESYTWPMMALGAVGVMSAVGNIRPQIVAEMCAHAIAGRVAEARILHDEMFELNRSLFFETNPGPLKKMMEMEGLGSCEVRPPLLPPSEAVSQRLRKVLTESPASTREGRSIQRQGF